LARRLVLLDIGVLSLIEVSWLTIPAYLAANQVPYRAVAATSLPLMAIVLACAVLWSFSIRGKFASRWRLPRDSGDGRIVFYAFVAYFWSIVDDSPVDFDSVHIWPQVPSGLQHPLTEVLLHVLTAAFMCLVIRQALAGRGVAPLHNALQASILTLAAFWASYFQNTPLEVVQSLAQNAWYPLDFVEHAMSVALLYLAVRACGSSPELTAPAIATREIGPLRSETAPTEWPALGS